MNIRTSTCAPRPSPMRLACAFSLCFPSHSVLQDLMTRSRIVSVSDITIFSWARILPLSKLAVIQSMGNLMVHVLNLLKMSSNCDSPAQKYKQICWCLANLFSQQYYFQATLKSSPLPRVVREATTRPLHR